MPSILSQPLEIHHLICEFLISDYLPSIYDLALVSRHFCSVTNRYRFHHLKFELRGRKKLASDVRKWTEVLQRASAFPSVCRLTIWSGMRSSERDLIDDDVEIPSYRLHFDFEEGETEDDLTCVNEYYRSYMYTDDKVDKENDPEPWGPFPTFLRKLSGLKDLIWACKTLLAPCLLQVLSEKVLSCCRLHNVVFKLPSLHYDNYRGPRRDVDQYEFSLATLPNLTRVLVPASRVYGMNGVEFNEEAILELLKQAPTIKHVHFLNLLPHFGSREPGMELQLGNRNWHGFFVDKRRRDKEYRKLQISPSHIPTQLRTLSITPAGDINDFRTWRTCVSFSELKTLQLWVVSTEVLQLATECQFPSLETLVLDPYYYWDVDADEDENLQAQDDGDKAASEFVRSLASLRSIHLSTGIMTSYAASRTISAILETHGNSLQKLSLVGLGIVELGAYSMSPDAIQQKVLGALTCRSSTYLSAGTLESSIIPTYTKP
ncbi:hypothetical protein BJY04DRAFT_221924 [Aspergillus karnatakaensis]|uniref:uncharacterized protein n=1 Tax=Aspergillus karnatakaensis TaxID=1810916 RepID=UPI003CCD2C27